MSDTLTQADQSLDACMERCRAVQAEHSTLSAIHESMRGLQAQIPDPHLREQIAAAMASANASHQRVAAGHQALSRSLEAAQLAVRGAAAEADGYTEPTHGDVQGKTYGSGEGRITGESGPPRGFTLEEIRQRDQRRGIEAGYLAKIKALRS
jgi:hypothetical protein